VRTIVDRARSGAPLRLHRVRFDGHRFGQSVRVTSAPWGAGSAEKRETGRGVCLCQLGPSPRKSRSASLGGRSRACRRSPTGLASTRGKPRRVRTAGAAGLRCSEDVRSRPVWKLLIGARHRARGLVDRRSPLHPSKRRATPPPTPSGDGASGAARFIGKLKGRWRGSPSRGSLASNRLVYRTIKNGNGPSPLTVQSTAFD
jgi:hypothetical protein